jgi:hypothetical protein
MGPDVLAAEVRFMGLRLLAAAGDLKLDECEFTLTLD